MKEIKTYFTNKNKLNKGHNSKLSFDDNSEKFLHSQKFQHILPPIDLITQYEELNPGAFMKLINISEQEQKNRHELNKITQENTYKLLKRWQNINAFVTVLLMILLVVSSVIISTIEGGLYGILFLITSVVIVLSLFIYFNKSNKRSYNNNMHKNYNKKARYNKQSNS